MSMIKVKILKVFRIQNKVRLRKSLEYKCILFIFYWEKNES